MRLIVLSFFVAVAAFAGQPPIPSGRPLELDALNQRVGIWDIVVTSQFTPDGPKFTGHNIARAHWSENRQFLISDEWIAMPGGWLPKVVVTSWDPVKKQYRETNVLPNGSYTTTMAFGDGTGTVVTESKDKGHITHAVTTIEKLSPTEYKFRSESSIDNGAKWVSSEGTSTKRAKSDTKGQQ